MQTKVCTPLLIAHMFSRIVITGMGVVSPAGVGLAPLEETLRAGKSQTRAIATFDTSDLPCKIGAPILNFDGRDFLGARELKRLDRSAQLFFSACTMAIADSAIFENQIDRTRLGVFEGSSLGGLERALQEHEVLLQRGYHHVNPMTLTAAMPGAGGSMVALHHKIHGPVVGLSNGSVSSACAIATAFDKLRLKEIDVAIAGGGEAPVTRHAFIIFSRAGLLSTRNEAPESACRPFEATRDGVVLGEGAAALMLERLESAQKRNAKIYGEILGVAMTNDAHHLVAPAPDAIQQARALQLVLEKAQVSPIQIDYISAHGTSTLLNDYAETVAIKEAFGERASHIPISASKSMLGHTLGACSAIETVATLIAMQQHFVPPTINLATPDPFCSLDYTPNFARPHSIDIAVVKNSSFGGKNSALLLKQWRKK